MGLTNDERSSLVALRLYKANRFSNLNISCYSKNVRES